jgi:endonuclease YncB( thermonuclease family)
MIVALAALSTAAAFAQPPAMTGTGAPTTSGLTAGGAIPYWQAPALPSAVIQGGAIPSGWVPQAVPYQGIGPDGRPITQYFAPTYVFTYQAGPPVIAGAQPVPVNRKQAQPYPYGQPGGSAPGWNYQTQGVAAPGYTLPPPTVARYAPQPYQYPPNAPQLQGTPITPPTVVAPAAAAAVVAPALPPAAAPPPPSPPLTPPPTQWVPAPVPPASTSPAASVPAQPVSSTPSQPSASRAANTHLWRVVGVHDGDTVTCLDENNQQQKIRLAEMDAPEIGQDFGQVARDALADQVFGKTVEVRDEGKDRYGRWIGHLSVNGVDVNRQMIATGNAWHYAAYSKDQSLAALQDQARAQRLGLWAQPDPIPPWEFRATKKAANAAS